MQPAATSFDFELVTAPFRMQPALRRIASGARQLTPALPGSRHLREKTAVLGRNAGQALLCAPGFDAAPALRAIAREAASREPVAFATSAVQSPFEASFAPLLGWSLCGGEPVGAGDPAIGALLRALPRNDRAAALVSLAFEEDFAVIDGTTSVVPWLAVCLPSHWAPEDKVGRRFAEVHAPVADNGALVAAGESLARLVTGGDRWERFVWTISADPRLDQHPARAMRHWPATDEAGHPLDADALAVLTSFRSERQTFIPIGGTSQAVFTIHVASAPLPQAIGSADAARRVRDALASMSPAVIAYKRLDAVRDRLLAWLARASGAT